MSTNIDTSAFMAQLAEQFVVSKSAAEYCRAIVLDPLVGKAAVGSQLFAVAQDGRLSNVSNFGKVVIPSTMSLSVWDENLVSKAVRENVEAKGKLRNPETGEEFYVFVYPYRRPSNPVGVLVMVKTEDWAVVLPDDDQRTLSLMGALWLETLGVESTIPKTNGNGDGQPLTERQKVILQRIAEGKTNAQIASELILSESSVRQETVKIYRHLGVNSRHEAARQGINQGIINRVAV